VDPFIGEIKMFCGNFAPVGWSFCDGSLVPISQAEPLFALINTTYGGDGQTTFGLPDLRGRFPVHRSSALPLGAVGGVEQVTLASNNVAAHTHPFQATKALADQATPAGNTTAQATTITLYVEDQPAVGLNAAALLPFAGGGQPHENMHPYQAVNYIIALEGIFPSRS